MNYSKDIHPLLSNSLSNKTSFTFSLALILAYGAIFLIGLLANVFIIVVIIKCRRMRTLTNWFLLNLAVSDLLATLICVPTNAYHHYDKRWIFGDFLCRFVPFIQGTSIAVSIFTLLAVSIYRFMSIHKPNTTKTVCNVAQMPLIIGMTWIVAFILMIPLIIYNRVVDPLNVNLTACSETWQHNMNARIAYDFLLLTILFVIPLTLMTYCYVRISLALWFIDSNVRQPMLSISSSTNSGRISTLSDDFPPFNGNSNRFDSMKKHRPYYIHYHKNVEQEIKRKAQQNIGEIDEFNSLINPSEIKSAMDGERNSTIGNETKPKSSSITATTITTIGSRSRRSSSMIGRRPNENGYETNQQNNRRNTNNQQHLRQLSNPYNSAFNRSSSTSLLSHNRLQGTNSQRNKGNQHRPIIDCEQINRFVKNRREVVKLLLTLVVIFFITRLPLHILSIYIDITSSTYLPDTAFRNDSNPMEFYAQVMHSLEASHGESEMTLVLYVHPILQLMSLSNSVINPLCYCIMSEQVKCIFKLIRQRFRRRGQGKPLSEGLLRRPFPTLARPMKVIQPNRNSFSMENIAH